jgi:exonuclease III
MRIVAWNIRAGGGRRVTAIADQLTLWGADAVALSEFRGTPPSAALAQALAEAGLVHQLSAASARAPAQNAVFIAARWPVARLAITRAPVRSGRWLAARIEAPQPFSLCAMHVPNRVSGKKWAFHDAVRRIARRWDLGPAIMTGDTNSGCIGIDEARVGSGFIQREHDWMCAFETHGWRDAFRHAHGDKREWTWHSPNAGTGYRLDQAFVNAALLPSVLSIRHAWGAVPTSDRRDAVSDHAAVIIELAS